MIIGNNDNLLFAKIENINGLGLLSIRFNHKIDLELIESREGKFLINNKMVDIYIDPFKERLANKNFNISQLNLTWEVISFDGTKLDI